MESLNIITQTNAIVLIVLICSIFTVIGLLYSKNFLDLNNYLVANRTIKTVSLTASFVSSSLGAWILFGPASAATWGGIGAVIGYCLGTAFPMILLIFLGSKVREEFSNGKTLIEVVRGKFGNQLFKLVLTLSIFYMTIFLIAEVTALSLLIKYLSGTHLWITASIVIFSSLLYTLYGGLRASILTDKFQFILFFLLLLISFTYLMSINSSEFNFQFIKQNSPELLNLTNPINFTAGFTFFIAVAATNLFHQGNWQRVYAAKSNNILKLSLILSFIIIIPIVFLMGFSGLLSISKNPEIFPDLAFFLLILKQQNIYISIVIVFLAISLTISSIDTLMNAISSLIIVDGKKIIRSSFNFVYLSKIMIIIISSIALVIASKGLSVLYLFLLADLFCCAAAITVFYNFYKKIINQKTALFSIMMGLISGLLFFPNTNFSASLLVGGILPNHYFPLIITNNLLFFSFFTATFLPVLFWKINFK